MVWPARLSHVAFLTVATVVLGILMSLLSWPQAARGVEFTALMLCAVAAALPAVQPLHRYWPALRLSFVPEFVALLAFGPHAAAVVATCGLTMRAIATPELAGTWQWLLRAVTVLVALQAAGFAYLVTGGTLFRFDFPWDAGPLALAVLAYCGVTSASAEFVAPLLEERSPEDDWRAWPTRLLHDAPVYFVAAGAAVILAKFLGDQAWSALVVAAVPMYLAYRVYESHISQLEDHASRLEQQQRRAETLSARARTVEALQHQDMRLRLAAEAASHGLWEWDFLTGQFFVTGPWKAMLGLPASTSITRPDDWLTRVHEEDLASLREALEAHLSGRTDCFQHEHRIRHADGSYRIFRCRALAERSGSDRATRLGGSLTDTTDLADTQRRLRHAVHLDPLTGLCNRAMLVESLHRRIAECQRRIKTNAFALLYLDLDRFKIINDSLGHLVGDELLVAVSRRLESCLRQGDILARLGGDEFAILLNGLHTDQQANVVAFRVQEALAKPFAIGGREVFTSASIGIAFGSTRYSSPDEMMHDADTAMYHAKAKGKARHEVFDEDMDARARDRLGLENDLRRAVQNNELDTHYQPIVALATGMCVGFESLVRWTRGGEPVSPGTFIPIAEELGLIEQLGTQVLEEACRTFAGWQHMYPDAGLECITVNVSSRQLMQHNFLRIVERAVQQARLKPSALRIEITETALMTNPDEAAKVLSALRDFGVKIYLDDFGTGYSSLSHLHTLPVDALKIDRSFVRSLTLPDRPAIVESILALARTLDTSVVAEGIEDTIQARELERLGCTHAQGYLFSRPLSKSAAERLLLARRPLGPKAFGQPRSAVAC